eukprot:GILI01014382.1.p1 GENE.GILI01014382.1~~GILI01014382.1.p1  ORF type:complete len:159 (+),score=38.78 GILI01014382.1:61-537(+)
MFDYSPRNSSLAPICSLIAGLLFGFSWFLFIDAHALASINHDPVSVTFVSYLPGIAMTIFLIAVNLMDWGSLSATEFTYIGDNVALKAKTYLFVSFLVAFSALFGAVFTLITKYANPASGQPVPHSVYPGVALLVQTVGIFVSALLFRLVRTNWGEFQ